MTDVASHVRVPDRLLRPDPIVRRLRDASSIQSGRGQQWGSGRMWPPRQQDIRSLQVSKQSLARALRIMQGLIAEARQRGHEVRESSRADRQGVRDVCVVIKGHEIALTIREKESGLQLCLPQEYVGRR